MSDEPVSKMTPDEVRVYRDSVDALIAACLELIRVYPIGADVEPAPAEPTGPTAS
jgi:hypothetical protein